MGHCREKVLKFGVFELLVDLDSVLLESVVNLGCVSSCLWDVCIQERYLVEVTENSQLFLEVLVKNIDYRPRVALTKTALKLHLHVL